MRLPIYSGSIAALPSLSERWLAGALPGPLPAEERATCGSCALAPPEGVPHVAGGPFFHPSLKCCTFVPWLPNFAVGGALRGAPEGARRVQARIAQGGGLTLLGLEETAREALLAREGRAGFGHARALACPYVAGEGSCSVWAHRNAVCATWFCRFTRGETSARLWRAAKLYLSAAERAVATHCALRLEPGDEALALLADPPRGLLDAHQVDDEQDPALARRRWGRWHGREAEFFLACAEEASGVDCARLRELGGVSLLAFSLALRAAWRPLEDEGLPERTALGSLRVVSFAGDSVTVEGYSPYDLVELPSALVELLPFFDGAPVEEARARALEERGVDVEPGLVRRLLDLAILVPAGSSTSRESADSVTGRGL